MVHCVLKPPHPATQNAYQDTDTKVKGDQCTATTNSGALDFKSDRYDQTVTHS